MRLHEHEAADIFGRYGIPVPMRGVAASPVEAVDIAVSLGCPVILKAQVLSGGRGLAGGIVTADTPGDIRDIAARLLESSIRGLPVRKILVSKKIAIARELYLGVTVDGLEEDRWSSRAPRAE
jgi:succinyl-CoA synthetase beta subunit